MLCRKCGKSHALVEDGLCAACADAAFAALKAAPGSRKDEGERPLPPPLPSAPYDPTARFSLLRSPNGFATAAVVLLCLVIVADLGSVAAGVAEYRFASDLASGDWSGFSESDLDRVDDLYTLAGRAQMLTLVAAAIGFIAWFLRVRDNAHALAPFGQSKARAWAIFGFFVPVVCLWFPRRIAHDTWQASADGLDFSRKEARVGSIDRWWFLWLLNLLLGWTANRSYNDAESIDAIKSATGALIFSDAVDIVSAVAAILFVRALTRLQNLRVLGRPTMDARAA
ncbi:DUF4328 domain-containing protein [Streptomyces sp. Q6]|uniref:DUF4328 domain-containing protein n=1 Tax=Streptomyces citrinus TaxID=3118173 RepID=A0ACD5AGA7_9ACTN